VRIVLDANILVRANPRVPPHGLARDLLLTIVFGPHVLVLSPPILTEVRRVLAYPHVQDRWPLTAETVEQYLVYLEDTATLVYPPESSPAVVRDPDDDPILQTAIIGRADVLCTRDHDFQDEIVHTFCAAHGIRILDDVSLIRELRAAAER
jgi:putative PIN family toxin of toxin-antitoxin system